LLKLRELIPELAAAGLARCLDYLFFPLKMMLKDGRIRSIEKELMLNLINDALFQCRGTFVPSASPLLSPKTEDVSGHTTYLLFFVELFNLLLEFVSNGSHDDLKLAAVRCIVALASSSRALFPDSLPASLQIAQGQVDPIQTTVSLSGFAISQLLDLSLATKTRQLKIQSMRAVLHLSRKLAPFRDCEALSCFLPGIASNLGKIVLGDFKQGHLVIGTAIKVYHILSFVVLCLNFECRLWLKSLHW